MAISHPINDSEQAHSYCRHPRELALNFSCYATSNNSLKELSIGMSNKNHGAVEEGATMMPLGTAIWGARRV